MPRSTPPGPRFARRPVWPPPVYLRLIGAALLALLLLAGRGRSTETNPAPNPAAGEEVSAMRPPRAGGSALATLRLRIYLNGWPAAARVTVEQADGSYAGTAPGEQSFWGDGGMTVQVQPGRVKLTVEAGPRALPLRREFELAAGQERSEELIMQACAPVAAAGWWLCDPYVEAVADDAEAARLKRVQDLALAARGEGLEIVGLGRSERLSDTTGGCYAALADGPARLAWALTQAGRERFLPLYAWRGETTGGAFYALELAPPALTPDGSGPAAPAPDLASRLAAIRDRGGLAVVAHPQGWPDPAKPGAHPGAAIDLPLLLLAGGLVDALDLAGEEDLPAWFDLLNRGYHLAALGGGPDGSERRFDCPRLGCYLELPAGSPRPPTVLAAIRQGRVIVANGPYINLRLDEVGPGTILPPRARPRRVFAEALAGSAPEDDIEAVELIYNGRTVRRWEGDQSQKSLQAELELAFPDPGWVVARYRSRAPGFWAVTNPIYLQGVAPAAPISAQATVSLRDAATGRPLAGVVEAFNLGQLIERIEIGANATRLALPATASLRLTAAGYQPREYRLYEDCGGRAALEALHAARPAVFTADETACRALTDALANLTLRADLSPAGTGQ